MSADGSTATVGLQGRLNSRYTASGYAANTVLNAGSLEHGMHIMTKPFPSELLAQRVEEALKGAAG